ncbi:MAG: TorF family putative porin [Gammaproteobacteria bacterium]|nr:TorF family putative porin [Gammaproteobacteria bacterium]
MYKVLPKSITLHGATLVIVFLANSAAGATEEDESLLSGSFAVGSDLTFRGISQTMSNYAIESSLELSLPSGLYAYAWGSNVDFVPSSAGDDGASHEIDLAAGYYADLTENLAVDIALIRYMFPGTVSDVDYDFNEIMATLSYAETISATVAHSDNVDGTGSASMFYRLGGSFGLRENTALEIGIGHYDLLNAYGEAYSYAEIGIKQSFEFADVAISYTDTSDSAEQIYYEQATGQRLIVSVQFNW